MDLPRAHRSHAPQAGWTTVSTERDFVRWREACGLADVLPAALLRDESVRFLQRKRAHAISAGAVLNRSGAVVGLTNLFSTSNPLDEVWGDVAALCGQHFPSCPIVGYQRGRDLDAPINTGFTDLAALGVCSESSSRGTRAGGRRCLLLGVAEVAAAGPPPPIRSQQHSRQPPRGLPAAV
jgi:hypothetical protein